jgi:hypothetical protein
MAVKHLARHCKETCTDFSWRSHLPADHHQDRVLNPSIPAPAEVYALIEEQMSRLCARDAAVAAGSVPSLIAAVSVWLSDLCMGDV